MFGILMLETVQAQDNTYNLTVYREFKPAVLHMASGRDIKNSFTNIFLKNGALLYKQGLTTMELNMNTIVGADFGKDRYLKIDNMLALEVDSVGENKLYRVSIIDMDSYIKAKRNDVNITNLDLGSDQLAYTTIDLEAQEGQQLPIIYHYYYLYKGKIVKVHEREISRILPKDKKRIYRTIISMDGFQWTDQGSLMTLLKAIVSE
jgi:hypothetical protein